MVSTAVREVISIDYCDDCMSKIHRLDSSGEVKWFIGIEWWWSFDGTHGAKFA
tara:strand:- start:444 stop:602 length:159 start_codon:yes stop_codon:yes gene_type:complete